MTITDSHDRPRVPPREPLPATRAVAAAWAPRRAAWWFAAVGTAVFASCNSYPRQPLLAHRDQVREIDGFEGVRAVNGYPSASFQASFTEGLRRRGDLWRARPGETPRYEVLVLGAGGPNGAFGAGLLVGWTESGARPEFDIVTGVSAGALLAPFAFVGTAMDHRLTAQWRELTRDRIYVEKGAIAGVFSESLMDAAPLRDLIAAQIDPDVLDAVARGHDDGRRLYVGTTDFDVGRLVVWDLGAIAIRRSPAALELFRRVLLASASTPVFCPPVLFAVRDESGAAGDEMHVDGSVASPMFLPHQVFDAWLATADAGLADVAEGATTVTVVHNGALVPQVQAVPRDTLEIAARSFLMAASSMAQQDVVYLYLLSRLWGAGFRFACIPDQGEVSVMGFTAADATRLYELGRGRGRIGDWDDSPPAYLVSDDMRGIRPLQRPQ